MNLVLRLLGSVLASVFVAVTLVLMAAAVGVIAGVAVDAFRAVS